MKKRIISILLSAVLTATSAMSVFGDSIRDKTRKVIVNNSTINLNYKANINKQVVNALFNKGVTNFKSDKQVELLVLSNGEDITKSLSSLGAEVNKKSESVYLVNIPVNKALLLSELNNIIAVDYDKILTLPKPPKNPFDGTGVVYPNMEYDHEIVGMSEFWSKGYDGKNTIVAILDTGVDPGNEMLKLTTDGKIKIIDYQDFWKENGTLGEADVQLFELEVTEDNGEKYVELGEVKIIVPDDAGEVIHAGYFNEGYLQIEEYDYDIGDYVLLGQDVNNNGEIDDKIPVVLLIDEESPLDSLVYVDTDFDLDLSDEKEMGIYKEVAQKIKDESIFEMNDGKVVTNNDEPVVKEEYKSEYEKLFNNFDNLELGERDPRAKFNFVVSDIFEANDAIYVNLSYDGQGHGTHVAGDTAGNGYKQVPFINTDLLDGNGNKISDGTIKGAAPGTQIMALRVFQSNGGTPQSVYLEAVEYACKNGADIINMSLGGLDPLNDGQDTSSIFIDSMSKKYGTLFCISAGNSGPTINTLGSPGTSEWAVTVGAYAASYVNYGSEDLPHSLHDFSSRGPMQDGKLKPTLVAPGDMVSASPLWYSEEIRGEGEYFEYGHMQGTSMSSPYAAGVIAAVKQAVKEKEIPYHPLVLKEALFQTGNRELRDGLYKPIEIGGGMIDPAKALDYLNDLNSNGLNQEELIDNDEFIDINDFSLEVEVDYSEDLNYKPEGLYVRNEEIPSSVEVTITNTTNQDLNDINFVKNAYSYSDLWLSLSQDSISLKKGESKNITLNIDKSKLGRGVNSLIIEMNDENSILRDGKIPVTIVNYHDMNLLSPPVVVEEESRIIRPGEWDSHFINIPEGTEKIRISFELTNPLDGGAYFLVAGSPSGLPYYDESIPPYFWGQGKEGEEGKVEFELRNPESGTWEFALKSYKALQNLVPDRISQEAFDNATGEHTFTAEFDGAIRFEPSSVNFSGNVNEIMEDTQIDIVNGTLEEEQNITLYSTGLINKDTVRVNEYNANIGYTSYMQFEFELTDEYKNMFFRTSVLESNSPNDYYYAYIFNGEEMVDYALCSANNGELYVEALKPGPYTVFVVPYYIDGAAETNATVGLTVVNDTSAEKVVSVNPENIELGREKVSANMSLSMPSTEGEHLGFIFALDSENNIIGKMKINVTAEIVDEDGIVVKPINVPDKFVRGKNAEVTVKIENRTNKENEVTLILALYDKETDEFIMYNKQNEILQVGEAKNITTNIDIPNLGNYIVRCYVWDTVTDMKSFNKEIEIPVE